MKKLLVVMLMGLMFLPNSIVKAMESSVTKDTQLRGNLEVTVRFSLPIVNREDTNLILTLMNFNQQSFQVPLSLKDGEQVSSFSLGDDVIRVKVRKLNDMGMEVSPSDVTIAYYTFTFYQLQTGKYQVALSGEGYKTSIIGDISLDHYSKRLTITNETGNFEVGDVNQDGKVTEADMDLLIYYLNTKDSDKISLYDLNRDGKVDIIDVSYISTILHNESQEIKILNTDAIIDPNDVSITGDIISGKVENLFTNRETVTLRNTGNSVITEETPVTLVLDFKTIYQAEKLRFGLPKEASNRPTTMEVCILDEAGQIYTYLYQENSSDVRSRLSAEDGESIVIDFGKQIAVKRVTIRVMQTAYQTTLAEIASVEFLNQVFQEIPKPTVLPPYNVKAVAGSEKITVSWDYVENVLGYEVLLEIRDGDNVYLSKTYTTTYNHFIITDLTNYTTYTIRVQSTSGEWKSGYSESILVTPIPSRKPPAPENIQIDSRYLELMVRWKQMDDTQSYNLFYRRKGDNDFQVVRSIQANQYLLSNLQNQIEYEIYITGTNELGDGPPSNVYNGITSGLSPPYSTDYKRINTSNGVGIPTSHIVDVQYRNVDMILYPEGFDAFNIVDDDYSTHWTAPSNAWYNNGPTIVFDQAYEMDHFIYITRIDGNFTSMQAAYSLSVCDEKGIWHELIRYQDNIYPTNLGSGVYQISFERQKVTKIRLGITRAYAAQLSISEMKFYYYDSLKDDTTQLFKDDLHIELNNWVTSEIISQLESRANSMDLISSSYHPDREVILRELALARSILEDTYISDVFVVKQELTNSRNTNLGFAMSLNDYQPLGIVAKAGDQISLYIGTEGKVMPQLVFTQYYPESGTWTKTVSNLKKGQNIVTVPQIGNMNTERGGAVYIRYPSAITGPEIRVRVSGGQSIPTLDLYGVTGEEAQKELIRDYIMALKKHVSSLEIYYQNQVITDSDGKPLPNVYPYQEKTSILNSTEIGIQSVLLSVPATKTLQGIQSGDLEQEVERLYQSLLAFEQMMGLIYTQKGLYPHDDLKHANDSINQYPYSRIGIRYTRMFDGAFMYATSGHIGIEAGSVPGLMRGRPIQVTESGQVYTSGFFGWGISHEIGHVIDGKDMVVGEVTNNIYSLFVQTADDQQLSRLESSNIYPKIYEKVTSHTTGMASNVFVSLGMFWQLHLAYDNGANLTDTNSFYARLNRLYRTNAMKIDKNQLLIRLASDAAEKDLTEFFQKWGILANQETLSYIQAKGYEKETRAIYYLNDSARRYRLAGGAVLSNEVILTSSLSYNDQGLGNESKQVVLHFEVNVEKDRILGYEILRNGVPIAFVDGKTNTYIDTLSTYNNQTFEYEIIVYDYYLNQKLSHRFNPIKLEHDGSVVKDTFYVTSNYRNEKDSNDESDSHGPIMNSSVTNLIDGDKNTIFVGNTKVDSKSMGKPTIIIDMNRQLPITGLRYTAALVDGKLDSNTIRNYKIYVSENNVDWILVKSGVFDVTVENPSDAIYFDKNGVTGGNQLWTYNVSYIKIVATNQNAISGAEIDLFAPPGDNVNLDDQGIGVLEKDFIYGDQKEDIIEKGSIIFTGTYRGNPAFNQLLLIDGEGNTINGTAIFMANLPDNAEVDEIATGSWIFIIDPEEYQNLHGKVKVQLYRVDDALTSDGQRFVSDTLYVSLKDQEALPNIVLKVEKGV